MDAKKEDAYELIERVRCERLGRHPGELGPRVSDALALLVIELDKRYAEKAEERL